MSYFSLRSTWLSLVENFDAQRPEGLQVLGSDFTPCLKLPGLDLGWDSEEVSGEDLDQVELTRDLRHRLFFHHQEWEFGPALLQDNIKLARAQGDTDEAVAWYCQARHVAQNLVEVHKELEYLLTWIEIDRVLAEIQQCRGFDESCAMYAQEGLDIIKRNRFSAEHDAHVTDLAVRFLRLLGRGR